MTMVSLLLALAIGLSGQDAPAARTAASVRSLPTFGASAASGRQTEWTVRWIVALAPTGALLAPRSLPEVNRFEIRARAAVVDVGVRERDPQIGADELVIVAVDAQGREVGWQHLKDPRIVRSEQPGRGGLLTGQVLHRAETELVVRVPDGLGAVTLRIYEPLGTGAAAELRGLGTIAIR